MGQQGGPLRTAEGRQKGGRPPGRCGARGARRLRRGEVPLPRRGEHCSPWYPAPSGVKSWHRFRCRFTAGKRPGPSNRGVPHQCCASMRGSVLGRGVDFPGVKGGRSGPVRGCCFLLSPSFPTTATRALRRPGYATGAPAPHGLTRDTMYPPRYGSAPRTPGMGGCTPLLPPIYRNGRRWHVGCLMSGGKVDLATERWVRFPEDVGTRPGGAELPGPPMPTL